MVSTVVSPPPAITAITLGALRAIVADMIAEHPPSHWRVLPARDIIAFGNVTPDSAGGWSVAVYRGRTHHVRGASCTCYVRRGAPCEHVLAVELYLRCEYYATANPESGDAFSAA